MNEDKYEYFMIKPEYYDALTLQYDGIYSEYRKDLEILEKSIGAKGTAYRHRMGGTSISIAFFILKKESISFI